MERGIYFDGWYKNNHCYHPSLPLRSMQMIEDIEKYSGTLLVWSALGGGSISLPFLEHEAYGEVDLRLRFYGYLNDKEFIEECDKRGIKVFGIVFEVQGWEFPIVIGEDAEGKPVLKEFNVMRSEENDWYGLREFTQDKHWELFGKKLEDYFPEGLYNSLGEKVMDLWWECCAKTYKNEPVHSDWVEVVDHKQIAYQMCRNNPVWREYLKKIMEIQIDAGVHGIQLDECELPMTSIGAGGCFCRDCMKGFREYLKDLKDKNKLSDAVAALDLDNFNYGDYINENDLDYPVYYEEMPLYKYYWEYQLREIKKYFKELVDHAKEYGKKTKGKDILVSGNFFTLMPSYFALEPYVDVVITEMKNTLFKQPAWYRYAAGFVGDKTIIVAENPYGGIIPELLDMLNNGKGYDLYRIFLLEAAVYGCNMAVPYGGWMGNEIKDAFYPPENVTIEVQDFIKNKEELFSKKSGGNVAVIYSYPSYYWREAIAGYSNNVVTNADQDLLSYNNEDMDSPNSSRLPFWEAVRSLSEKQICYDVITVADGDLKDDNFSLSQIEDYDVVILPDCTVVTENQAEIFEEFAKLGKQVIIWGRYGENMPNAIVDMGNYDNVSIQENPADKMLSISGFGNCFEKAYEDLWQIRISDKTSGVQTHEIGENKKAIHLIQYDYDKQKDFVPAKDLVIEINGNVKEAYLYTLTEEKTEISQVAVKDNISVITLKDLPLYSVIEIHT